MGQCARPTIQKSERNTCTHLQVYDLRRKWSMKKPVTTRDISFQSILGHARNFELLQSNGNLYERSVVYFLLKD